MYQGVIRNRNIYSLNPTSWLSGDSKFVVLSNSPYPPFFVFNETKYANLFFVNKHGIFVINNECFFKKQRIYEIYSLFATKKFNNLFKHFDDKISQLLQLFSKNNIHITFYSFEKLQYNHRNVEYHTNLSKETITLFQALNSTLPYP